MVRFLSGLAALVFLAGPAAASFQSAPNSIKAEGMGGAFTALADDPTSVFLNPAGLSTLTTPEASMMYGSPLAGSEGVAMREGYGAIGIPLHKNVAVGTGATMFQAGGLLSEYQFLGSMAVKLGDRVALGASADYLYHSYDIASDPVYSQQSVFANGHSRGAIGLDFGAMAFITKEIQLGASVRNANSPDVGLASEDRIPREIRFGSLYKAGFAKFLLDFEQRGSVAAGSGGQENVWRIGTEVPIRNLAIRAGMNTNAFTAGLGLDLGMMRVDYAFSMMRTVESSNYGNQLLSVSMKFGGSSKDNARNKKQRSYDEMDSSFFGIR